MLYTDESPSLTDICNLYGYDFEVEMSDYPIWDEGKRAWLNSRIYDHFEFRIIAQDTPGQFFKFLRRRMNEMMPTVNPLFEAFGAMNENVDVMSSYLTTDDTDANNTTDNTTTDTRKNEARQLFSNTPQTQLSGAKNYATNLTETEATDADTATSKTTDSGKTIASHTGRQSTQAEQASIWLANANNTLYIVYNGLEPLFQQVWDD